MNTITKSATLKVVKKTFLEKVNIDDYFKLKLVTLLNQERSLH